MTIMAILLHITERDTWERALREGIYRADSLETEGFIHLSTPAQALFPANAFYRGRTGLVLLVIDPERLSAEVRREEADGQTFPHLYGPLNVAAVTAILPLEPQDDGTFALPQELIGYDAAQASDA